MQYNKFSKVTLRMSPKQTPSLPSPVPENSLRSVAIWVLTLGFDEPIET
jgi:hypothetical protein